MAKSKNKPILIFSSSSDSLRKITCNCCEKNLVVASIDKFCPICFSEFKTDSVPVRLSASSSTLEPRLTCEECGTDIYSNSLKDNKALASSMFCPKCGGSKVKASFDEEIEETFNEDEYEDVEASNDSEYDDVEEDFNEDEYDDIEAKADLKSSTCADGSECEDEELEYEDVEASNDTEEEFDESEYKDLEKLSGSIKDKFSKIKSSNEYDDIEEELAASEEEYEDENIEAKADVKASTCEDGSECESTEEEPMDYSDIDPESLEASFLNLPEPTWMFFSKGNPVIKLKKSRVSADSHLLFATSKFPELFLNRMKESCVATAIKDFNAEVFNTASLMNSVDLENMAFEKLQANILPKFQDCMALTIEGAAKGVYPELNQELKASFFDAFVSRGMPESQVKEAIEASFLDAGPIVFSSIIAKATELMYKKEEAYSEIKATIQASGTVRSVTEEDMEAKEFKAKLKAGNLPFSTNDLSNSALQSSIAKTSLDSYRNKIKFKK